MSPIQTSTVDTAVAEPATRPPSFDLTAPPTATSMRVTKRNGGSEAVDLNKIVRAVTRAAEGLPGAVYIALQPLHDNARAFARDHNLVVLQGDDLAGLLAKAKQA